MANPQPRLSARGERLVAAGSVVVAPLASRHHAPHLLLMLGLGGAGQGTLAISALPRRGMLLVAPAMAALTGYRLLRHPLPRQRRALYGLLVLLTLALLAWSIGRFGL
jgi:hypothetical protein